MILQNTKTDFSYGDGKIAQFAANLSDMRNDDTFREFYDSVVNRIGESSSRSKRKHNYKQLYFEVFYNITNMLTGRFADCQSFKFLEKVNPIFFDRKIKFLQPIEMLKSKYGPLFKTTYLESLLAFIYKDTDFHKEQSSGTVAVYLQFQFRSKYSRSSKIIKIKCVNCTIKCLS